MKIYERLSKINKNVHNMIIQILSDMNKKTLFKHFVLRVLCLFNFILTLLEIFLTSIAKYLVATFVIWNLLYSIFFKYNFYVPIISSSECMLKNMYQIWINQLGMLLGQPHSLLYSIITYLLKIIAIKGCYFYLR